MMSDKEYETRTDLIKRYLFTHNFYFDRLNNRFIKRYNSFRGHTGDFIYNCDGKEFKTFSCVFNSKVKDFHLNELQEITDYVLKMDTNINKILKGESLC